MKLIKTKSFELAVNIRGSHDSSKLAMLLPGQLDTKDYAHMTNHVDYLSKKGYLAISFDPPGTWESPGSISLYTMTNYLKAINELIKYFGNKPTVLMGHSRGGSMAMLAGPKNEYVTHIIAVMSSSKESRVPEDQLVNGIKISYRDIPPGDTNNKKRFNLPLNYFEDAKKHNILEGLRHCTKPKLFFYGIKDELIPPEFIKNTYNEAAKPKEIHELNSDHDYRYHNEIVEEVNEITNSFLEKYKN